MVKSGSFRPGKSGPAGPSGSQGRNGPSGSGGGTTHTTHSSVGTNRGGSTGKGQTQFKPGGEVK